MRKFVNIIIIVLLLIGGIFFFWRYYFVFGEGAKAGELNFFVKKGYIWKTYEGRLIQTGYKSQLPGSIQSNEFDFSVTDEAVARQLMANSGRLFELHYKEYLAAVPWRGKSRYVVDSILAIHQVPGDNKGIR